MSQSPSPSGPNGRSAGGQFGPGNKAGKGNPFAKRVAKLRSALFRAVTPADLTEVVRVLVSSAKSGDVAATKELLQRLLGPPVELDFIERMAALEKQLAEVQQRGSSW
ncbi:MAG: hypothetical protein JWN40_2211 [Phycisphaerales bacterium]|nr:hypothetical protein [Phycisphaerales bacterium]